jgi:hypothetical protein
VRQSVAEPDVLDEVGRVREPGLAGAMVHDLEPARAGYEVHVPAADLGMRVAIAVVQREGFRRARDRGINDVRRKQHSSFGVGRQAVREQALA